MLTVLRLEKTLLFNKCPCLFCKRAVFTKVSWGFQVRSAKLTDRIIGPFPLA
jgi:hypothetical protein